MNKYKLVGNLALFVYMVLMAPEGDAATKIEHLNIPYIKQTISVDGVLDETVWDKALKVNLSYEIRPAENIPAVVQTSAYIFENGENIYVGFDARDNSPQNIRAYLSDRDELLNSDYVTIAFDTFNDSRKAFKFYANAAGVQADSIIDEITSGNDFGWDSIWQSMGKVNSKGYAVEMSIPLKSLRFEDNDQAKKWGIRFSRVLNRNLRFEFSNVAEDRNNDCGLCQFATYQGFENTSPAHNLTLIPAITATRNDDRGLLDGSNWENGNLDTRESLDLRWGINQNLFLNATINPDFSQVEADALQLEANKRFAVFVPEKRAFFLDGADYFSNWSRFIHTKLFAEPEYGLKVTGKQDKHSFGIMTLTDKDTTFLLPGNQSSRLISLAGLQSENQMLRYRYDLGEQGNIGMTYTDRSATDYSNKMLAIDGKYWFGQSDFFKFQAMSSENKYPLEVQEIEGFGQDKDISGNALSVNFTHAARDWEWQLTHHRFGEGFRADSGFVSRSNWQSNFGTLIRRWYPEKQTQWWTNMILSARLQREEDLGGELLKQDRSIQFEVFSRYQSLISASLSKNDELFLDRIYQLDNYNAHFEVTPTPGLDLILDYVWGNEIDFSDSSDLFKLRKGDVNTLVANVDYQLNQHVKLSVEYVDKRLQVVDQTVFDINLYNFRAAYQLNVNSFVRLTIQADSSNSDKSLASQWLYSYRVNPFTLFYLGYSDQGFQTIDLNDLRRVNRTLFMKFSYAWQM